MADMYYFLRIHGLGWQEATKDQYLDVMRRAGFSPGSQGNQPGYSFENELIRGLAILAPLRPELYHSDLVIFEVVSKKKSELDEIDRLNRLHEEISNAVDIHELDSRLEREGGHRARPEVLAMFQQVYLERGWPPLGATGLSAAL